MDFNDSDLNVFQNHIKAYSKNKLSKTHKAVGRKQEKMTEKKIGNFLVKVGLSVHPFERVRKGSGNEFFCKMMERHKRK